jgi:hypothetical protein
MSSVTIKYWAITVTNLTRVVNYNNLGDEMIAFSSGVAFGVRADISSLNILNGDVFNVETNIISWGSLRDGFVMHFN